MNRRQWFARTAAATPAAVPWLLPGHRAAAQPPAAQASALKITDVKTTLTAPAGIRLVVPERDPATTPIVRASGLIAFEGGEVSTFDVGYTAATVLMDLQLLGTAGV